MPSPIYSGRSYAFFVGDGTSTTFPLGFDYLDPNHIVVKVNESIKTPGDDYLVVAGDVTFVDPPGPATSVKLIRNTPLDYDLRLVDFRSFGAITEDEMDKNQKQLWYLIQEADERDDFGEVNPTSDYLRWNDVSHSWDASRDGQQYPISNVKSPTLGSEAATKDYVDAIAEFGIAGNPQTWTFQTSGSSTSFTLTNGVRLDPRYLIVSISGVVQVPLVDFDVIPGDPNSTLIFLNPTPPVTQTVNVQNFGKARFLNTAAIPDHGVTEIKLDDAAVSSRTIQAGAVTAGKLGAAAVLEPALADQAVSNRALGVGAVKLANLSGPGFTAPLSGSYHKYLRVNKTTGALELVTASAQDLPDWLTELANVRLNQLAVPNAPVSFAGQKLTNLGNPVASTDAAHKAYVDAAVGTGVGPKTDLLADYTLGLASTTWELWGPSSNPAWWQDNTYLYYTVTVSNWRWTGPGKLFVRFYQGGGWNEDRYFGGGTLTNPSITPPSADFAAAWSFMIQNPRDGSTKPFAMPSYGTYALAGFTPIQFGPSGRVALRGESSNINQGARVQVYGHKALT